MEQINKITKSEELFKIFESGLQSFSDDACQKAAEALKTFNTVATPLETLSSEKHVDEICAHFLWDNGRQQVFLCPHAAARGVLFDTLENIQSTHPEIAQKLACLEKTAVQDAYGQMIAPNAREAVVLYIPNKMCQKREYLLDLILSQPEKAASLKIFVFMEDDARGVVTVNLRSRNTETNQTAQNFFAGMLYAYIGSNADLILNEIQDFSLGTCSVMQKRAIIKENGHLRWHVCELGALRSSSSLEVSLQGQDSNALIYGLYFPNKNQRMKLLTRQDHVVPHTFSDLRYKGAVTDQASSSWEGMIYVAPGAIKADGYQKNENLLLSENAHAFSKPGLEIITDDVKCSHGTTITDIDDNQIFYLSSRGIPEKDAERLVIQGFFDTVLNLISFSPIRMKLQEKIGQKMIEGV